jgi:putative transposase
MHLIETELYHVYNQGNNQEIIFRESADYLRFLTKYRALVRPYCETICYSLMPNHFHFLIQANKKSIENFKLGNVIINNFSNGFRLLQSEYAKEYNEKYGRSGSLFRQKTQGKLISNGSINYGENCFHYIHQNAWVANLVSQIQDWKYSSFKDYLGVRNGTLCNIDLGKKLVNYNPNSFLVNSCEPIKDDFKKNFYR